MSIFDIFEEPDYLIEPTSDYDEMLDKIESNKEDAINGCESVVPKDDFNGLLTDIMNDFDDDSDSEDSNGIITDDFR